MQITDAQVHIWAASTPDRPLPSSGLTERPSFLPPADQDWVPGRAVCAWLGRA